jgi:hypothetical protein
LNIIFHGLANGLAEFSNSDGAKFKIRANSEEEARQILLEVYSPEFLLANNKKSKIIQIKSLAKSELEATDWKVQRQREQITLGIDTSLSLEQYIELLTGRQAIRTKSNELEAQVNAAETIEELNGINW